MAATATLLPPERAAALRRAALALAALAGTAGGAWLLGSQPAVDFLREGPARVLPLEGGALRPPMAAASALAAIAAAAALWRGVTVPAFAAAAAALGAGMLLVHVVLAPAAGLVAVAVAADGAGRLGRERLAAAGPRRYPLRWAAGAVAAAAALAVLGAVSWYLASPLFDAGERLDEELGFAVAGLDAPAAPATAAPSSPEAPAPETASTPEATPTAETASTPETTPTPETASTPDPTPTPETTATPEATPPPPPEPTAAATAGQGTGQLIAMGPLEGADSFHTASGRVLLVRAPDGRVILRFEDYAVRNGPGLYVYLTPDPDGDVRADGALEVSAVRATSGSVNYDVPNDVDPSAFRAAVIYCRPFSVTFATARLE